MFQRLQNSSYLAWNFGFHKVHNKFPNILRYLIPRRLTLDKDHPVYKWMWWWFSPKNKK